MSNEYSDVRVRFLRDDERLMLSEEKELPLVIEPNGAADLKFLKEFLKSHSIKLLEDIKKYGAVLLRGFEISSDEDFETTILSIQGLKGISEALMSEHGRIQVPNLKYVLHTNSVYKTGGTLYLGGFHSENYYSPDVPSYIFFCCHQPSMLGGETGLINMEKVYQHLSKDLKEKLEKRPFFAGKWLISEIANRYNTSHEDVEKICINFDLPITGSGDDKFVMMYKPAVFEDPRYHTKSLQINFFEIPTLNTEIRKYFRNDYQGKPWFWHRALWRLPNFLFKPLEHISVFFISMFYSPKETFSIFFTRLKSFWAGKINPKETSFHESRVDCCFNSPDISTLAKLMRRYYCSCLWQKGDILLVDNQKVAHAGMPGGGPRLIRAMISNPIDMSYSPHALGCLVCKERNTESIGYYMANGNLQTETTPNETHL